MSTDRKAAVDALAKKVKLTPAKLEAAIHAHGRVEFADRMVQALRSTGLGRTRNRSWIRK
jgi:hypothetical protein